MSLENLVDEIRARGQAELEQVVSARDRELAKIASERDAAIASLREASARSTDSEVARDRAQRLAAAHLSSRRILYEAREELLTEGLGGAREALLGLVEGLDYPSILKRMIASATARLGKGVRISGRAEDAGVLSRLAGKAFDETERPILGGVVAETPDGRRRLDLSLDELLRQRADAVRGLLA
jgi:vacuolar-type H+-ATPase subunit E/Vma4